MSGSCSGLAHLLLSFSLSQAARARSTAFALLEKATVVPSGDHREPYAPLGMSVNCHASPPAMARIKICGGCGLPSFSVDRSNARYFPSGDQRGPESCLPEVNLRGSPPEVETLQIEDSYSCLSPTAIRTSATCEPSGEIRGLPIH